MVQMTANQVKNQMIQYTSSAKVLPSFVEESPSFTQESSSFTEELPSFAEYFFLRTQQLNTPKPQNSKFPK
jgi:hypothetical protein